MKVSELEGAQLDYWVAKAEGDSLCVTLQFPKWPAILFRRAYSTDWSQGGPIIERERIMLEPVENWVGHIYANQRNYAYVGNTPLIAAMRCFVASKFGEEVEDVPHA